MKIAIISRRYPPLIGGAERILSYLAEALANTGAEVYVLTAKPLEFDGPDVEIRKISNKNGKLAIVRLPTSRLRFVGTWLYMRALRSWLIGHRMDIAYVSMLKHDAYTAVKVGKALRFPVVLRPEGAGETGDIAWQSWGRFGSRIAKICKRADRIVSISDAVTVELERAGYDRSKISELPNGVPIPRSMWKRRKGWQDEPWACYVGRLAPEKGVDTLIDAWPKVLETFPKARLRLVGEGPERPSLEARISALGLQNAITLQGASSDPSEALRNSDLFVLPSREEGMSIALLEAMALGIPLVATSIPGNLRLVTSIEVGRVAKPDDPADFAQAIIDQWSNFDAAERMARAARIRVTDSYSIKVIAGYHIDMFRWMIISKMTERLPRKEN